MTTHDTTHPIAKENVGVVQKKTDERNEKSKEYHLEICLTRWKNSQMISKSLEQRYYEDEVMVLTVSLIS